MAIHILCKEGKKGRCVQQWAPVYSTFELASLLPPFLLELFLCSVLCACLVQRITFYRNWLVNCWAHGQWGQGVCLRAAQSCFLHTLLLWLPSAFWDLFPLSLCMQTAAPVQGAPPWTQELLLVQNGSKMHFNIPPLHQCWLSVCGCARHHIKRTGMLGRRISSRGMLLMSL